MQTGITRPLVTDLITLATFNINGFVKWGWHDRSFACAEVIHSLAANALGLQEVQKVCLESLERARPDVKWLISDAMGDVHNVIGYSTDKFKCIEYGTIPLSPTRAMKRAWRGGIRCMMFAILYDKITHRRILIINFHLDNKSTLARNRSIDIVLEFIDIHKGFDILVTGDANFSVDSPYARWHTAEERRAYNLLMERRFQDCWRVGNPRNATRPFTYHGFKGLSYTPDKYGTWDTDILLASENFKVFNCSRITQTGGGRLPSDHFPVQTELILQI